MISLFSLLFVFLVLTLSLFLFSFSMLPIQSSFNDISIIYFEQLITSPLELSRSFLQDGKKNQSFIKNTIQSFSQTTKQSLKLSQIKPTFSILENLHTKINQQLSIAKLQTTTILSNPISKQIHELQDFNSFLIHRHLQTFSLKRRNLESKQNPFDGKMQEIHSKRSSRLHKAQKFISAFQNKAQRPKFKLEIMALEQQEQEEQQGDKNQQTNHVLSKKELQIQRPRNKNAVRFGPVRDFKHKWARLKNQHQTIKQQSQFQTV